MLAVMLFAATPAAAGQLPTPGVDGGYERLAADRKALQERAYGETDGVRYTFCAAFARAFTLGVSEVIMHRFDDGFPVLGEASKINPGASMAGTAAGTVLGVLMLASFVYPPLARALKRRRAARKEAADRFDEPVEREAIVGSFATRDGYDRFDEPVEREVIIGSFVTRDGYEFVVTRSPRKLAN